VNPDDRILAVLSDGNWHDSRELDCPEGLTRQITLLRLKGHQITMRPGTPTWQYRLLAPIREQSA
jgi:hypothetical protein